jgi:hypothetical protein
MLHGHSFIDLPPDANRILRRHLWDLYTTDTPTESSKQMPHDDLPPQLQTFVQDAADKLSAACDKQVQIRCEAILAAHAKLQATRRRDVLVAFACGVGGAVLGQLGSMLARAVWG